ncbi:hypothetical protein IH779_01360 [Patescibacteria group bacterium]|nr:hypothetical protein [Patescibacteria group bacterium]
MKKFLIVIFILLTGIIFLFIITPWRMTFKTFNFLLSVLPVEVVDFKEDVIQEIHQKDQQTAFYVFRPASPDASLGGPADESKYPGMVVSLGIHPKGAEGENLQNFFQRLVQNKIVVVTVDSQLLKESLIDPKEIENLVEAFQLLEKQPYVYSNKIGFFGLSVGSSLAFLAAADPAIQDKVKYILWTGGYFDAKELIQNVLSKSFIYQKEIIPWDPSPRIQEVVEKNLERFSQEEKTIEGKDFIEKIKETTNRTELEKFFQDLPPSTAQLLESISPKTVISEVKAPLFILHGKKDQLIPFPHSILLSEMYPGQKIMVLSDRYGHVSPEKPTFKDLFSKEFWQVIYFSNKLLAEIF